MGLMFNRLARNFVKNGYYPTDSDSMERVLNALAPAATGQLRIIDPTVGEGVALAEVKHHLGVDRTHADGVEIDQERAYHAKQLLDRCIHGDLQDCMIGIREYGFLLLNPPYGAKVADKGQTGDRSEDRLEKLFYRRTNGLLQFGGVLVLIIPRYTLDRQFSGWIASHFTGVRVFEAVDKTFKQVVVMGVKRRASAGAEVDKVADHLFAVGRGDEAIEELPEEWPFEPYVVPAATKSELPRFQLVRLDMEQLAAETQRHPCLWSQFDMHFGGVGRAKRRPLRALSEWHLALALAAGELSGKVTSRDGRTWLVKGDTYKEKVARSETHEDEDSVTHVRILTDRFVPVIRALDFTPGPNYGQTLVIR